ncbi:DNA-directed RNA polymerase II largest subunit, putative [Perkinsus marinus ATCC 50983]|uniref:DNA-directed RNA polymerase II largest subunit, putative n=1 Tax=Perkinsus marinus (strain ATCC 50983 / TXsc) TaxID=423536 RepID=C5M0B7_PERM5|nr:DNA-directed RNA polymerase II largest subunit, putative [Perkinsus marinus ATCC 50983]EEQ97575.1 DNA-directed RNA polymerase II largest subunit, putative [Perkinsus marinus ATCC 50983]|eukprot:XP_002764858.1 DNA-directed RNA polymerase II largest subunit, putative [Perkinsus marinus ATCC 50983]
MKYQLRMNINLVMMMMMGRSGIGLGTKVYKDGESRQRVPINVRRLIDQCHYLFPAELDPDFYPPQEVVQKVEEALDRLRVIRGLTDDQILGWEAQHNAAVVLQSHLRYHLASRKLLERNRLGQRAVDWLVLLRDTETADDVSPEMKDDEDGGKLGTL